MRPGDRLERGKIMDESTKRLLVKKIRCHGQAIAPFQGLACGYWAVAEPESPLPQRVMLLLAEFLLPVWTVVSWRAMHGRSLEYWRTICYFGLFIEVAHTSVVVVAVQQGLDESLHLLACIFSALHIIETAAYLVVTTFLRESFVKDTGTQAGLLWDDDLDA
jgi:hypothetical protein